MQFNIVEDRSSSSFAKYEKGEFSRSFVEAFDVVGKLTGILSSTEEYSRATPSEEEDMGYIVLDNLADFPDVLPRALMLIQLGMGSSSAAIHRRLDTFLSSTGELIGLIKKLNLEFLPPSPEDTKKLSELSKTALAGAVFYLYYQFEMGETEETLKESRVTVTKAFSDFLTGTKADPASVVTPIRDLVIQYSPKLPVFEAYPELESQFLDVVGVYIQDLEDFPEVTNLEFVRAVIDGTIDVEEAIESLVKDREEANERE